MGLVFTCPVCGWPKLTDDPKLKNYDICECCGTEFGYDDQVLSHADLRKSWVESGMTWFSDYSEKPENWNPWEQLRAAGFIIGLSGKWKGK